ncbi:hypothetical protein EON81_27425 [bacterium]|nr:MAG: hypothetical protein EON81_27425 [bacterium]
MSLIGHQMEAEMEILAAGRERAQVRWGEALTGGFTIVPDVLLKNQGKLGLGFREMCVLVQLLSFWWVADEWPRPQIGTLAKRVGSDERTVQRAIGALVDQGLIERTRVRTKYGDYVQGFSLSGLVARLETIAEQPTAQADGTRST